MNGTEIRQQIRTALSGLAQKPLPDAAAEFFAALGYRSERRLKFPSLSACLAEFDREGKATKFFPEISNAKHAKPVIIQQLTSEEIAAGSGGQLSLLSASLSCSVMAITSPSPSPIAVPTNATSPATLLNARLRSSKTSLVRRHTARTSTFWWILRWRSLPKKAGALTRSQNSMTLGGAC